MRKQLFALFFPIIPELQILTFTLRFHRGSNNGFSNFRNTGRPKWSEGSDP